VALGCVALGWNRPGRARFALELTGMVALTAGSMVKPTIGWLMILLAVVSVGRQSSGRRALATLAHLAVIAAIVLPLALPYAQAKNASFGLSKLEVVAGNVLRPSPARVVETLFASILGAVANAARSTGFREALRAGVYASLLAVFVVALALVLVGIRRVRDMTPCEQGAAWGWTVLLFLLTGPVLFSRYVAWVLPLVWLLPRTPRLGALGLAVAVRLVDPLAVAPATPAFYLTFVDVMTAMVGIAFTVLLVLLLSELWSRTTSRLSLDTDLAPSQLLGVGVVRAILRKT
jgi:hypothetical protein